MVSSPTIFFFSKPLNSRIDVLLLDFDESQGILNDNLSSNEFQGQTLYCIWDLVFAFDLHTGLVWIPKEELVLWLFFGVVSIESAEYFFIIFH